MDLKNITDYFRKQGVHILSERTAFDFITSDTQPLDPDEMQRAIQELVEVGDVQGEVEERVFRQAYIPKTLFEVVDPERDTGIVSRGGAGELIYAKFLDVQETKGVKEEMRTEEMGEDEEADGEEDDSESEDDDDDDEEEGEDETGKLRGKKHEDKEAKKVFLHSAMLTLRNASKRSKRKPARDEKPKSRNQRRSGK
jgi:RIO kinase 1